ncbi:MAG TPA: hypothetical protein ACFCUD_05975 [Cyclobacteriaceae bacterium]
MKRLIYLLSILLLILACNEEDDLIQERLDDNPLPEPVTGTSGSLDLSNYVALGNSISAGFMDGALYNKTDPTNPGGEIVSGQQKAFPKLLSEQFKIDGIGGGDFSQPVINSENGFNATLNDLADAFTAANPAGRTFLNLNTSAPEATSGEALTPFSGDVNALNNLSVPGARVLDFAFPGYATLNPYYARFATSEGATIIGDAIAKSPTFFTLFIGSNDALGWALSGGTGPDGEVVPSAELDPELALFTLTSINSFTNAYSGVINALVASNSKGVAINIPNITLVPFFQAIPYNAIPLSSEDAAALNAGFQGYNSILDALAANQLLDPAEAELRKVTYSEGANPILINDDQLNNINDELDILVSLGALSPEDAAALAPLAQARQMKSVNEDPNLATFGLPAEIVLLTAGGILGTEAVPGNPSTTIGTAVPLSDSDVLTTDEIATLVTRIATFNGIIQSIVQSTGGDVVLWDANAFFQNLAANGGINIDGFFLTPDFSPNGVFSTDGIHPNPRGHVVIANEIIELLNSNFGASIPPINTSTFGTVLTQ